MVSDEAPPPFLLHLFCPAAGFYTPQLGGFRILFKTRICRGTSFPFLIQFVVVDFFVPDPLHI